VSVRTDRVASVVKEEIGTILQKNFTVEESGLITVTEVRMSPDLKIAKVYVSVFGDGTKKEKGLAFLEEQKSFIRSELGHHIRLKFTPSITFHLDDSLDRAMKIENILNQIHKESQRDPDK
jgi:ribosome-binding factor A